MKRIFPLVFLVFVVFSCKKDFSRQPVVSTGDFDLAAVIAHGTLVDKEIVDHGFCWNRFKKARSQKLERRFEVRRETYRNSGPAISHKQYFSVNVWKILK